MNLSNKKLKSDAKTVSVNLLWYFSQKLSRKDYLDSVVDEIAAWTDCRCIGIRILDSEGCIPYEACTGFESQFLEKENKLSIKTDVCACIRVISGELIPADRLAKTPYGSFICENSDRFLADLSEDQKASFRGVCIETGFKTICIIPVRYRNQILGAIHLADQRKEVIHRESIEHIESIAKMIGEAVFRYGLEKELQESENRYKTLIENSVCGVYLVQNGKIIFANEAFAAIHGYTKDEMIGMDSLDTVYPMDRHLVDNIRKKRLKGVESPTEYEIRGMKKNGDISWLQRRNVLVDHDGKPAILGYEVDITEQREKESALQESYELLETIFSNVHFLIAYMDRDFNFIRVNRAYAEADGHSPEFFIGKNHFDLYPSAENEKIFRMVVATGKPFFVDAKPSNYPSNPERGTSYWDWSLLPTRDSAGIVCGAVLSLVNVTERKKAEEELKKTNAKLEQRTDELRQRAAQLSRLSSELTLAEQRERDRIAEILHDHLQQLLVGARMGLESFIVDPDNDMETEVGRVLDLIDQSIKTSRNITTDLRPPVLDSNNLSEYLDWLARWMLKTHGFAVKLEAKIPVIVGQTDIIILLFLSVRELLFNALKHSGVKSATVKAEMHDYGNLRIIVKDNGGGFNPEIIWKDVGSASKFGLITIRERLTHLGGRFEIESTPGSGSTISLIVSIGEERPPGKDLTALTAETPGKPISASPGVRTAGRKIRIMLADDHPVMREGLSKMLNSYSDIEVVGEASDGEEAVRLARELIPDVILMDISMPKMDGLEATRIIHPEFPHIRIIGLSMYDGDDIAEAMINAGAASYRSKSGDTDRLLAAIRGEDQDQ